MSDLQTGTIERVNVDTSGDDADDASGGATISGNGRYVGFGSIASDLEPFGDHQADTYVRDLQTGTTTRASVDSAGGPANGPSGAGVLSDDGRYVAFLSRADDLVPGDGNGTANALGDDVFVRDLQAGTTTRVSVDTNGGDPNGLTEGELAISGNGRYVAFESWASDLVAGDGNDARDVFVRDLQTGITTRATVDSGGGDSGANSETPSMNGDGRYVAFMSQASDLVPEDNNDTSDVFVRDLQTGVTTRVSEGPLGQQARGPSQRPSISSDGRYIGFMSIAPNLVRSDDEFWQDIFVRAVVIPTVDSITPDTMERGSTASVTVTGTGFFPGASAFLLDADGVNVNAVSVVSETQLEVSMSANADAPTGTRDVVVFNPGTGPGPEKTGYGLCPDCLTIT